MWSWVKHSPDKHDYPHFSDVLLDDFPRLSDELDVIRSESRWSFILSVSAVCCPRSQSGSRDRAAHADAPLLLADSLSCRVVSSRVESCRVSLALLLHHCQSQTFSESCWAGGRSHLHHHHHHHHQSTTTWKRSFVLGWPYFDYRKPGHSARQWDTQMILEVYSKMPY